eukprot:CAMPEP_0117655198 /NCGR_PEP_ID=MMETSP0804-20121206/4152_1 /TAXON_ID=1074897 /ORGANISM="Tetraselmis astigmatica, Strain CCMP880" /LENGTH=174 /DNA_ID=CAMNT_0005461535 /DNA_START=479 /DNA_END=1003 /DNA_ORIENTATION=-
MHVSSLSYPSCCLFFQVGCQALSSVLRHLAFVLDEGSLSMVPLGGLHDCELPSHRGQAAVKQVPSRVQPGMPPPPLPVHQHLHTLAGLELSSLPVVEHHAIPCLHERDLEGARGAFFQGTDLPDIAWLASSLGVQHCRTKYHHCALVTTGLTALPATCSHHPQDLSMGIPPVGI